MSKTFIVRCLAAPALMLALFAGSSPSWAISLDDAKQQGLVGEQASGYLDTVKPGAAADVQALVADINAKRRAKYESIAASNKTSLQVVEALAGKTAIEKTPAGQYVKTPSGAWVVK